MHRPKGIPGTRLSRRLFVRSATGLLVLPLVGCGGGDGDGDAGDGGDEPPDGRDAGQREGGVDGLEDGGAFDAAADAAVDAGPPLPELCQPFLTPDGEFPPLFGGNGTVPGWQRPELDRDEWRLSLEGLVQRPRRVSLAELEADTDNHVRVVSTLQCVFGSRGTAIWTGVPVRILLEQAGLQRESTRRVRLFGADGFANNLRLPDLYEVEDEVFEPLVVFRMNGEPIDDRLGGPARVLLSDRYGFKNIKWVIALEATADDADFGQYQVMTLSDDPGLVDPNTRVDSERTVPAGPVTLCGHGLSGFGGVERVQVSIDGQPFESVRLLTLDEVVEATPELRDTLQFQNPEQNPWPYRGVWAPWEHEVELSPGEHRLAFRILDRSGEGADGFNVLLTAE